LNSIASGCIINCIFKTWYNTIINHKALWTVW
jgi:hypothetical protein